MKFMYFFYPAIPATMDEREQLRPIAARNDRFQAMLDEVIELSRFVEDLGFAAVAFPEHHLHTEGSEMGSVPGLTQHVLMNTKKLIAGPIGYVLPGWNPLRLALETAYGAASLARESAHAPAELRRQVTSPGGTTERALASFAEDDLAGVVARAVAAAHARSAELAEQVQP